MISPAGTFAYTATVPEHAAGEPFTCTSHSHDDQLRQSERLDERRLVGLDPEIRFEDGGLTPDPCAERPLVERTRVTLKARTPRHALLAEASFHIDKVVTDGLRPGDTIHLVRTSSAGVGFSAVRARELIAAFGAVTAVPLSDRVSARSPYALIQRAVAIFRERDATFDLNRYPTEIRIDRQILLLVGGRREVEPYQVFAIDGFVPGVPGTNESVAIVNREQCRLDAAIASAFLIRDPRSLSMVNWP